MRAINHALTGALIGLSVANPVLALPLAFASHFAQDAIPHHDDANDELTRIRTKQFKLLLVVDAVLCAVLVALLAIFQPQHWLVAAFAAFAAASPDLLRIKKFIVANKHNELLPNRDWLARLHHKVQWWTGPQGAWVELVWFLIFGAIFLAQL